MSRLKKNAKDSNFCNGLIVYMAILNSELCPKGKEQCHKYARNVVETIQKDYEERDWKSILLQFIEKVKEKEKKEVVKALTEIMF